MINSIIITNHIGDTLTVNLREAEPDHGLLLLEAEGLGPVTSDINMTELAASDGAVFSFAKVGTRNIVFQFRFAAANTIEETRHRAYRFFMVKREVEIVINTDTRSLKTIGYVESNDPSIFSETEGCQISIICPDPFLYLAKNMESSFSYITSRFEFPFSNESVTEPLIQFSEIDMYSEVNIWYDGEIESGIIITIHFTGGVGDFTIYNETSRESMTINAAMVASLSGGAIRTGDEIIINTNRGKKSIYLLRAGKRTNILNSINRDADWFQLHKGDNVFVYRAVTGYENMFFYINSSVAYEGV